MFLWKHKHKKSCVNRFQEKHITLKMRSETTGVGSLVSSPVQRTILFLLICLVQNPDIPQACRAGAHDGLAGRGRAALYANIIVRLGSNPFSYSPKHRHVA